MSTNSKSQPLAGVRVLVVHHYEAIRWLAVHLLRRMGAEALEAGTATGALVILETVNVDLLLVDCDLPDMPAAKLRNRLREKPAAASVPIVYVGESEAAQQAAAGEAVLVEPIGAEKLLSTILCVLGRASSSTGSKGAEA
jgi:CheY-like chemotaxis protein